MKRLGGLLLVILCFLNLHLVSCMATESNSDQLVLDGYIVIDHCEVDCKTGNVENLTKYLSEHISLGDYTIILEKLIPADLAGEKYWILYKIYKEGKKTPYCVWVYSDQNRLQYSSKWNQTKLDALERDEKPFLLCWKEFEETKQVAYKTFNDSILEFQRIAIWTDNSLMPRFHLMNSYMDVSQKGIFVLTMRYFFDKDIIPGAEQSFSDFKPIQKTVKLDFDKQNFQALEKFLSETIEGFEEHPFELEAIFPVHTVETIYQNKMHPNDDTLGVSSRYYVSIP